SRKICQCLPVERYIGLLQTIHEFGIAQVVHARRRIDAHNPEASEVTFPDLSVAVCELEGALDGFFGRAKQSTAAPSISLCRRENLFTPRARLYRLFHSGHRNLL